MSSTTSSSAGGVLPLRVVFMGTPELACASLAALVGAPGIEVVAVVTQPDRPKGRELKLQPSPVKVMAAAAGIPVLQPERAREASFIRELRRLEPDLVAVAAYGQLLPQDLLDLPRHGCLNVHTSLLPRYRGAAPIQWAILNDDPETGVTIMKLDAGLDTGAIVSQRSTPISPEDTAETLHDRLASLGAKLLVESIPPYVAGQLPPRPQPSEGVVYAPKIKKTDGLIDWKQSARSIWNRVRGLRPWPGAFTWIEEGAGRHLLKLWGAEPVAHSGAEPPGQVIEAGPEGVLVACGQNALRITELQREGGRRLSAREYLAGHSVLPGCRLG